MVPMAAAVGLSLTPSRYVAARAAGGVVLAIAANVARQAAVATRKRQAPQAMLELLRKEGAGDVTREQVCMDACYSRKCPRLGAAISIGECKGSLLVVCGDWLGVTGPVSTGCEKSMVHENKRIGL